jgi:hypothetical protein
MRNKLILVVCLSIILQKVEGGFFKDSWNKITGGNVGSFLASGGTSGVVSSSLEPAIARYESANANSIHLLDNSLKDRVDQLGNVLEAREDQLDEIFKSSISLMDEGMQENISKLDESLRSNVGDLGGQLSNVSYTFSNSLWKVFKATLLLIGVLILVLLSQRFYSSYYAQTEKSKKGDVVKKYRFPFIVSIAGIIIIYFLSPNIFSKYVDSSYQDQQSKLEQRLAVSDASMNYIDAYFTSSQLVSLDNSENKYYYFQKKYELLKEFLYRPKLALFEGNYQHELGLKLLSLEKIKENAKYDDPDYSVLIAIYYFYYFHNQYGDLAAAFLSNEAIKQDADMHKDGSASSPLMFLADNFIRNYNFHPIFSNQMASDFITSFFNASFQPPLFPETKIKNMQFSTISEIYTFNNKMRNLIRYDQGDFINFLNAQDSAKTAEQIAIGTAFRVRWDSLLKQLKSDLATGDLYSSALLKFDDSYVTHVDKILSDPAKLNIQPSADFTTSVTDVTSVAFTTSQIPKDPTFIEYNKLSPYKKLLVTNFINKFDFKSKGPIIKDEVHSQDKRFQHLIDFASIYIHYLDIMATKPGINIAYNTYLSLAKAAAEINFYDYSDNVPVAFGLAKLKEFEKIYTKSQILQVSNTDYQSDYNMVEQKYINNRIPFL